MTRITRLTSIGQRQKNNSYISRKTYDLYNKEKCEIQNIKKKEDIKKTTVTNTIFKFLCFLQNLILPIFRRFSIFCEPLKTIRIVGAPTGQRRTRVWSRNRNTLYLLRSCPESTVDTPKMNYFILSFRVGRVGLFNLCPHSHRETVFLPSRVENSVKLTRTRQFLVCFIIIIIVYIRFLFKTKRHTTSSTIRKSQLKQSKYTTSPEFS